MTGLDAGVFRMIELRLAKSHKLGLAVRSRSFCTPGGISIDASYVRHLMKRLAKKAEIDNRVHAHELRPTHASELAAERKPLNVIQAELGHSSLATTNAYLQHIQPQDLIDEMQARRPWIPEKWREDLTHEPPRSGASRGSVVSDSWLLKMAASKPVRAGIQECTLCDPARAVWFRL